jgi:ABC-type transporter Mla MlaB component
MRTIVEISGVLDGSRTPGLLLLKDQLIARGLGSILVSVERVGSIDSAGAVAVIDMLRRLREGGLVSHLAVGPKGMSTLLAAVKAGRCSRLSSSVRYWMDVA